MAQITVKTGSKKDGNQREASFEYPIPETLPAAVSEYTEDVVYGEFMDGITLSLQAPARRALVSAPEGSDYNQVVQDAMAGWKPGVKMARKARAQVDPMRALESAWPTLSIEKKMEIAAKFGMSLSPAQGASTFGSAESASSDGEQARSTEGTEAELAGRRRR